MKYGKLLYRVEEKLRRWTWFRKDFEKKINGRRSRKEEV